MMREVAQLGMMTKEKKLKQKSKCRCSSLFESASLDLTVTKSTFKQKRFSSRDASSSYSGPAQRTVILHGTLHRAPLGSPH